MDAFETKIDKVLAYLQGVQDLPTLKNILNALNVKPPPTLDMTDRRAVVRALTSYLNDEEHNQNPRMDQKLDRVFQIQLEYFDRNLFYPLYLLWFSIICRYIQGSTR